MRSNGSWPGSRIAPSGAPGVGLRVVAASPPVAPVAGPAAIPRGRGTPEGDSRSAYRLLRGCSAASITSELPSRSFEPALELYRDQFELALAHREVVTEQGVEAVLLDIGENHVELLAPLGPETPVGKFLARSGPRSASRRLPGDRHQATLED